MPPAASAGPQQAWRQHPGYPPYRGYPGYRQPSRQSHAGLALGLSGGGLVLVLLVTFGVIALTNHHDHVADVGYSPSTYSTSTSTHVTSWDSTSGTSSETTTTETSTETTSERTTERYTTEHTRTRSTHQRSGPQPVYKLKTNPLFTTSPNTLSLANRNCSLSRWGSSSQAKIQFFTSALRCLNAVWKPVLQQAELPFSPPDLKVPTNGKGSSPCSSTGESFAAYYCPVNETMYMPLQTLQIDQYGAHPGVYLAVLAHEYGHHVQYLSGIMKASTRQSSSQGGRGSAGALAVSRRLELEAQCFSGVFVGSARGDVDENITREAYNSQDRGDHNGGPRTHGTDAHEIGWWRLGYKTDRVAQCNTWAASAADTT